MLQGSIGDEACRSSVGIRIVEFHDDVVWRLNRKQQDVSGREGMPAIGFVEHYGMQTFICIQRSGYLRGCSGDLQYFR